MNTNEIHSILAATRLNKRDIYTLCREAVGLSGAPTREALYAFSLSSERLTAYHALHVLTLLDSYDLPWIEAKRDLLIDRVLQETDPGKSRLLLKLLLRMHWSDVELRTDFIDFCLDCITRTALPYAVRAQCMKLACKQMTQFTELTDELESIMQMLDLELLSPGLRSARRQVLASIKKARMKQSKQSAHSTDD